MLGGHQGRGDVAVHEVELRGVDRRQEGERGAPARGRLQVQDQRGLPAGTSVSEIHSSFGSGFVTCASGAKMNKFVNVWVFVHLIFGSSCLAAQQL